MTFIFAHFKVQLFSKLNFYCTNLYNFLLCVQATVILGALALASAGVVSLGHGYAGEAYGQEAIAYAPVAQYGGHEDTHVDYHVSDIIRHMDGFMMLG